MVVGPRYIEFEEIREEASLLRARFFPAARGSSDSTTQTARQQYARALLQPAADPEKVKHLHRGLARHFHPDLASDHARRVLRERLMTDVNLAFEDQDLRRLQLLAGALDHDENGDAARQLAAVSVTPVNELRERAEYAARQNHDLLAELAASVARQSAAVKERGATYLHPETPLSLVERALADPAVTAYSRCLRFPAQISMGELTVRAERDIDAPLSLPVPAQGALTVPFGKAVILRLSSGSTDLSPLLALDREDLHGVIDEWPAFVSLNDEQVQPLAHFSSLEVIQLGRTEISGRVFDHFPSLHELRVLVLEETEFDDAGLLRLEECVWMQRLDLSFTQVTGPGLRAIRNMTALRDLSLYGTAVADGDLAILDHVPGLRKLNLGLTAITDNAQAHLRHLRFLEVLHLGGTAITDSVLSTLAGLPALRELVLWETGVSDAGLDIIGSFAALRYLDTDQTKVTPGALAAFRVARPEVRLPCDIWADDGIERNET